MPVNHVTPSGRYLGRIPDKLDPRDKLFRQVHPHMMASPIPSKTNNLAKFPAFLPVLDQGQSSSCGPHAAARWHKQFWPHMDVSRLELYWQVRVIEGTTGTDAGVETRDLFKVMQSIGVIDESEWPFDISKLTVEPPPITKGRVKISSYERCTTAAELLQSLANSRTVVMGFEVPASFDDPEIAKHGVLRYPQLAEPSIGGHDTHVVDYDLNFKESAIFKASGVDPALMTDHAICVENSWSDGWGLGGFFWMALPYAVDQSTGADLWTGKP